MAELGICRPTVNPYRCARLSANERVPFLLDDMSVGWHPTAETTFQVPRRHPNDWIKTTWLTMQWIRKIVRWAWALTDLVPARARARVCVCARVCYCCAHMQLYRCTSLCPPKGGQGCLMSPPLSGISGLSFDSTLLSPLLFFCLVLLPFLSHRFLPACPFF